MDRANNRLKTLLSRAFGGAVVEELGAEGELLRLSLTGRFGNIQLDAIWIGVGWPADVEQALVRLPPSVKQRDNLVFAAQKMSPGARRLLGEMEVNWSDETGDARIVAPGVVVIREQPEQRKPTRSLSWSPSTLAVAEALLAGDWREGVRTTELANLVQWSPGRVSNILQLFDEEGWTVKYGPQRGSGAARELSDPSGLLDAWATSIAAQNRKPRLVHRALRAPLAFLENELAPALNQEVRWALSGWVGAHLLAPIADNVPSLQIYIHEEDFEHTHDEEEQPLDRALKSVGLSEVAEGGRIELLPAHPSVLALARPRALGNVVSTPRVYADLLALGGRGEDAAMHLREELLDRRPPHRGRRQPPEQLTAWERNCRERLALLAASRPALEAAYALGTWSASYRLIGIPDPTNAEKFLAILREAKGHETGWPPWMIPDSDAGPRAIEGMIECWFEDTAFGDAAHADYWLADPTGRLCLIRGYQEDSPREDIAPPGEFLDPILPIWRSGECLLHAARLAHRLDATAIQFMMCWSGLRGRKPLERAGRGWTMVPTHPTAQREVTSFIEVGPSEVDSDLPGTVRTLLEPLYETFDFLEPPEEVFELELATMRRDDR